MSSLVDAIQQAGGRMRTDLGMDADLPDVARRVGDAQTVAEAVVTARQLLAARRRTLEKAQQVVSQLSDTVVHLARILPFTQEGWPEYRAALLDQLDSDLPTALAAWLGHWFGAAADHRLDALARLRQDVKLPPGAALVHDRALSAEQGLRDRVWAMAEPMLRVGVHGLDLAGCRVPDVATSERLRLLLVRVALSLRLVDEAGTLLDTDDEADVSAAHLALRARVARSRGDKAEADSLSERAQELDPRDLDVTVELIHRARHEEQDDLEGALSAARVAVDALQSLADLEGDFGRLLDPPAELWVAAAERLVRESDRVNAAGLHDAALDGADYGDHELRAVIHEARAELATTSGGRRQALRVAGDLWLAANQIDRAQLDAAAAMTGDAVDSDDEREQDLARLDWAHTVALLAAPRPVATVRAELEWALAALLTARTRLDITTTAPWSLWTEMTLRHQLARDLGPEQESQMWMALMAAARYTALDPGSSFCWVTLAQAAQTLDLFRVGETAAGRARELEPSEDAVSAHVQALANVGKFDTALRSLADDDDPWSQCVRGYALLMQGDRTGAIRILEKITIDPTWAWAWESYLGALIIGGDLNRAQRDLIVISRGLVENSGERAAFLAALFEDRIDGRFELSLQRSREFRTLAGDRDDEAANQLGQSLVLSGDPLGWELIAVYLSRSPSWNKLVFFEQVTRPMLQALATTHRLPPLDFEILEPTLSAVRLELARSATPVAELRAASATAETPAAAEAAVLTEAVVASITAADAEALDRVLEPLAAIRAFVAEEAALRHYGLATITGAGRVAPAPAAVDDGADADAGVETIEPGYLVRMQLPTSWFVDHHDPVGAHPLFVRYLPEMRLREHWEVPAVKVEARDELEPGNFLIATDDGGVVAQGSIDPALRYCTDDVLALLPADVGSDPRIRPTPHGRGVPADLLDGARWANGETFTMTAVEVAARVLGDAVRIPFIDREGSAAPDR